MPRLVEPQPKKKLIWHNVKPTPPGTVKMLLQAAREVEEYVKAIRK
jgi:hypothetical protein